MSYAWYPIFLVLLDLAIVLSLSVRIIMLRRAVGVSLAWIGLIVVLPLAGAVLYLLIGENRVGRGRARHAARLHEAYAPYYHDLKQAYPADKPTPHHFIPIQREAESMLGIPALPGNELQLYHQTSACFEQLIRDIDAAEDHCDMLFYIWWEGGLADDVAQAVMRARKRGVQCRILLDDMGSRRFLRSPWRKRFKDAGVEMLAALPVGILRAIFARLDLRNHRKIVVIDGKIGYVGSQNLFDPAFFGLNRDVGRWIDAMVRIEGPAVEALNLLFLQDWNLEANEESELPNEGEIKRQPMVGQSVVQVVPSGPFQLPRVIHEMILSTLYTARERLIITTPYFVPDDSMLDAMIACARRGVHVTLVVPKRVDSPLVRLASVSFYEDLMRAGIEVAQYRDGLLHAKTISVDGQFAMIGSVNMDMRSFWINFEIALFVYDSTFTDELTQLQHTYLAKCDMLNLQQWANRPFSHRLLENSVRLLSPLL